MNYTLLIGAVSAFVAASVFLVALLNYLLGRKLPNENKLFEEKFRSYRSVVAALNTAAAVFIECANEYDNLTVSRKELEEIKDELDYELNKAYFLMEDTIHEQMFVLSEEVLGFIDDYFELFDQEDFLLEMVKPGKSDEFEKQVNNIFDVIIDAIRKDLSLEKLDKGLKKRIGSNRRVRRLNIGISEA